jgi:hypothetical protein
MSTLPRPFITDLFGAEKIAKAICALQDLLNAEFAGPTGKLSDEDIEAMSVTDLHYAEEVYRKIVALEERLIKVFPEERALYDAVRVETQIGLPGFAYFNIISVAKWEASINDAFGDEGEEVP